MQAFKVGLFAVVLGTIGAVAILLTPSWFPVQASIQAQRHDEIYQAAMIMASYIFALVVTFLGYSMWKFRAKPGDMSDGEPIHGNTALEIIWTLIPMLLVLGFAVYGAIMLSKNENTSNTQLVVNVTGREFEWNFDYPSQKIKDAGILEVPVNRKVGLPRVRRQERRDPRLLHPGLPRGHRRGARRSHPAGVTPIREGTYAVICNMLCGIGHSQMRTVVNVVSEAKFNLWVKAQLALQNAPAASAGSGSAPARAAPLTRSRCSAPTARRATRSRRPAPPAASAPTWTTSPPTPPSTAAGSRPRTTSRSRSRTPTR